MSENFKTVLSLRDVRLASTAGHIVQVKAGVPKRIPNVLFLEAAKNGCVDYNPQMIEAFRAAVERAESMEDTDNVDDVDRMMLDSVRQVLLAADDNPMLLTQDGSPRVPAVRAAYEHICATNHITSDVKITPDLVRDYYLRITEEIKPAPQAEAPRYPDGIPQGDLEGEEVGGIDDELLESLSDVDED